MITVCDQAAGEQCPLWFGKALKAHWGLANPSRLEGSDEKTGEAFRRTIEELQSRITQLREAGLGQMNETAVLALFTQLGET